MLIYEKKYLKYKQKYLDLKKIYKNIKGGIIPSSPNLASIFDIFRLSFLIKLAIPDRTPPNNINNLTGNNDVIKKLIEFYNDPDYTVTTINNINDAVIEDFLIYTNPSHSIINSFITPNPAYAKIIPGGLNLVESLLGKMLNVDSNIQLITNFITEIRGGSKTFIIDYRNIYHTLYEVPGLKNPNKITNNIIAFCFLQLYKGNKVIIIRKPTFSNIFDLPIYYNNNGKNILVKDYFAEDFLGTNKFARDYIRSHLNKNFFIINSFTDAKCIIGNNLANADNIITKMNQAKKSLNTFNENRTIDNASLAIIDAEKLCRELELNNTSQEIAQRKLQEITRQFQIIQFTTLQINNCIKFLHNGVNINGIVINTSPLRVRIYNSEEEVNVIQENFITVLTKISIEYLPLPNFQGEPIIPGLSPPIRITTPIGKNISIPSENMEYDDLIFWMVSISFAKIYNDNNLNFNNLILLTNDKQRLRQQISLPKNIMKDKPQHILTYASIQNNFEGRIDSSPTYHYLNLFYDIINVQYVEINSLPLLHKLSSLNLPQHVPLIKNKLYDQIFKFHTPLEEITLRNRINTNKFSFLNNYTNDPFQLITGYHFYSLIKYVQYLKYSNVIGNPIVDIADDNEDAEPDDDDNEDAEPDDDNNEDDENDRDDEDRDEEDFEDDNGSMNKIDIRKYFINIDGVNSDNIRKKYGTINTQLLPMIVSIGRIYNPLNFIPKIETLQVINTKNIINVNQLPANIRNSISNLINLLNQ
jgi:hypothetical protein